MTHTTKENRDIYYRKAKEEGYRARSAYKLLQIFESYHILYPILDKESALSILINSSCSDCQDKYIKSKSDPDLNLENVSKPESDLNYDSDSNLTDYINTKRSCLNLGRIKNVIDLCSAPGSWSQLLRNLVYHDYITLKNACNNLKQTKNLCNNLVEYLNIKPAIISIDLQQMAPIDGVYFLKGDITDPIVLNKVSKLFLDNVSKNINHILNDSISNQLRKNAQLITCDGAPDVSGLHETDSFLQSSLIKSALLVCLSLLDPDGYFICKTFFGSEDTPVFNEVCAFFDYCTIFKPPASRTSSFEHFIVAIGFRPLGNILINPELINNSLNYKSFGLDRSDNVFKSDKFYKSAESCVSDEIIDSISNHEDEDITEQHNKEHDYYINSHLNDILKSIPQILSGDLSPYDKLPLHNIH